MAQNKDAALATSEGLLDDAGVLLEVEPAAARWRIILGRERDESDWRPK